MNEQETRWLDAPPNRRPLCLGCDYPATECAQGYDIGEDFEELLCCSWIVGPLMADISGRYFNVQQHLASGRPAVCRGCETIGESAWPSGWVLSDEGIVCGTCFRRSLA